MSDWPRTALHGRKKLLFASVVAVVAVVAATTPAGAAVTSAESATAGDSIVILDDGTNSVAHLSRHPGVAAEHVYSASVDGYSAELSSAQVSELRVSPDVASVVPNGLLKVDTSASASLPPQPDQVVSNGVLRADGLASPTAKIDGVADPMPVDVAVFDTGIDKRHPDLNVRGGVDCGPGKGWGDVESHGTAVAGLAAAVDNTIGRVGLAPGARLWSVRVADANGYITDADLLFGIDWVTKHSSKIEVANLSRAGEGQDTGNCGYSNEPALVDVVHQAICRSVAKGVTYVVSAGNYSDDAQNYYPASYDEVITVSAISDKDGQPGGLGGNLTCFPTEVDDTFASYSN